MQLQQQNQPQDFGQPPDGHPAEDEHDDQDDGGGGDESDDMAAAGAQDEQPPPQDGDEQQFGKGGKPGGEGLHRKVVTDKNGHQTTHWVRGESKANGGERAHGGREAFNKAKTDGRTKLNYSQWVQVRTPNFKRWFGDWERSRNAGILQGNPVATLSLDDAPKGRYAEVVEWAARLFSKQGGKATNPELGDVILNAQAARDSLAHGGANVAKRVAFKAVKDVIERGAIVKHATDAGKDSFYISAPVLISDRENIVTVLVRRHPNTQRMYLHAVTLKENLPKSSVSAVDAEASEPHSATTSGDVGIILRGLLDFKPSNSISLVDHDTGEPIVVYHGGGDFKQIVAGGRFDGAIFVKEGGASGYGNAQYPLFLRGKVLELDEMADALAGDEGRAALSSELDSDLDDDVLDAIASALTDGSHYPDDERVMEAIGAIDEADAQLEIQRLRGRVARALGYTAVRTSDEFDGDSLMVVSASAIKSAVGNNGNFDEREDDITKAEQFGPITKAIGMPPVIRISLPGVEDEAASQ